MHEFQHVLNIQIKLCLHKENCAIYDGIHTEFKEPRDLHEEVKC